MQLLQQKCTQLHLSFLLFLPIPLPLSLPIFTNSRIPQLENESIHLKKKIKGLDIAKNPSADITEIPEVISVNANGKDTNVQANGEDDRHGAEMKII